MRQQHKLGSAVQRWTDSSCRAETCMHLEIHTHLEEIKFKRLACSFLHSEASVEYLLHLTKLPATDMLFNKWREGTGTKTNKQQKFLRRMERQASCHRSRGLQQPTLN